MVVLVRIQECIEAYNERLGDGDEPMTQARLAQALDVSEAQVSHWKSGRREIRASKAFDVARLLDCDLSDLLAAGD
jgi:transcriptional regulator with XRE-family HTH domain